MKLHNFSLTNMEVGQKVQPGFQSKVTFCRAIFQLFLRLRFVMLLEKAVVFPVTWEKDKKILCGTSPCQENCYKELCFSCIRFSSKGKAEVS